MVKKSTGVCIDEDLLRQIDKLCEMGPGTAVRAPRSAVINELIRKALEKEHNMAP